MGQKKSDFLKYVAVQSMLASMLLVSSAATQLPL
eukprot:CAMPEP_0195152102 /NCGR_PEP_ID=MMETSP0448-20130528/181783_1 /TAXON_ID=66468 /ORGANISM="Heterocapsa triquestra, Strain CCMP 448" /LENGTH=33 /DNA_ID= /DNA_START= /DNA_END= /DNA_ORIENTATION=